MKFKGSAIGCATILALAASQKIDDFLLPQNECQESKFYAAEKNFFTAPFKLHNNAADVIECPDEFGFTTIFAEDVNSTGFSATASEDFFFQRGVRSGWSANVTMLTNLALRNVAGSIRVIEMKSGENSVLKVDLNIYEEYFELVAVSQVAGSDLVSLASDDFLDETGIEIWVSEAQPADSPYKGLEVGLRLGPFRRAIFKPRGFLPLLEDDSLSVEMLSGSSIVGAPLEVQVERFYFEQLEMTESPPPPAAADGNGATVVWVLCVTALLVGGMEVAATVYRKKKSAKENLTEQEGDAKEVTV